MKGETVRTRNPERTRCAALDAAERLFAERGFAGTSMREIAEASGISQPLIQHHFGHKEDLYAAALSRAVEAYIARFPEAALVTDQPIDLPGEMKRLFMFTRESTLALRMVEWARLEGRYDLVSRAGCLRGAMIGRIARAQQLGLVRDDIDAASLAVMLEALVFHWVENRALNAELFPDGSDDDAYLGKAVALFERGSASAEGRAPRRRRKLRA